MAVEEIRAIRKSRLRVVVHLHQCQPVLGTESQEDKEFKINFRYMASSSSDCQYEALSQRQAKAATQWLTAHDVLAEDLDLVPRIHIAAHNFAQRGFKVSNTLSDLHRSRHAHSAHTYTHVHKISL